MHELRFHILLWGNMKKVPDHNALCQSELCIIDVPLLWYSFKLGGSAGIRLMHRGLRWYPLYACCFACTGVGWSYHEATWKWTRNFDTILGKSFTISSIPGFTVHFKDCTVQLILIGDRKNCSQLGICIQPLASKCRDSFSRRLLTCEELINYRHILVYLEWLTL